MSFFTRFKDFESRTKAIFYGMEFTNGIRRDIVGSLMLLYLLSLGHEVLAVTSMFAASRIIMTLFEFPTGAFADQYSRKKSVLISFSLMALAFLGIFIFRNFWLLALMYVLHDIAWTFQSGTTTAWVIDTLAYGEDRFKLSSLFARFFFYEKTGAILGGIIGLIIVSMNFRFVWLAIALANVLMLLILLRYMEEKNFKPKRLAKNFVMSTLLQAKDALSYLIHKKNKQIKGLASAVFFGTLSIDAFFVVSPLVQFQILGIAPAGV